MELITNGETLSKLICKRIEQCEYFSFAVAWANDGNAVYKAILDNKDKIQSSSIGIHFYQTAPQVLQDFLENEKIRFVMQPRGTFHPKIYFFSKNKNVWALIVGSSNLTTAAFTTNTECAFYITSKDLEQKDFPIYTNACRFLEEAYEKGIVMTKQGLEEYKIKQQPFIEQITHFNAPYYKKKKNIQNMSWEEYLQGVRSDELHSISGRISLLSVCKEQFKKNSFSKINDAFRNVIAGISGATDMVKEYQDICGWFGTMGATGIFMSAIQNKKSKIPDALDNISKALENIPLKDAISKDNFFRYIELMQNVFFSHPNPRARKFGMAMATRLIAMKRPDIFLCINNANEKKTCDAFGLVPSTFSKQETRFKNYWDLIKKIQDTEWYNTKKPNTNINHEQDIWYNRVAMLDAIYYAPTEE